MNYDYRVGFYKSVSFSSIKYDPNIYPNIFIYTRCLASSGYHDSRKARNGEPTCSPSLPSLPHFLHHPHIIQNTKSSYYLPSNGNSHNPLPSCTMKYPVHRVTTQYDITLNTPRRPCTHMTLCFFVYTGVTF